MNNAPAELGIVILAGGQGQRMNGLDKGWLDYHGQPLIQQVIRQLRLQSNALSDMPSTVPIVISANRNLKAYAAFNLPVLTDDNLLNQGEHGGPLMGIQQALTSGLAKRWLSWPVDAPHVPTDYVHKMAQNQAELAVAITSDQYHYTQLLINSNQSAALKAYLNSGQRSIKGFLAQQTFQKVEFSGGSAKFMNFNYPHQLNCLN